MKTHLQDFQLDENKIIALVRKWDFAKRKLHLIAKKVNSFIGQIAFNHEAVTFRLWLDEAEMFLKHHSKEGRNTQEILKIKVILSSVIFI